MPGDYCPAPAHDTAGGHDGYRWATDLTLQFMRPDYLPADQSLHGRVTAIGDAAGRILGLPDFPARFVDYMKRGWFSLSTPVWTNFGTGRGLPISCFGCTCGDTTESILRAQAEVSMQSKHGGGTSVGLTPLRHRGAVIRHGLNGKSSGVVHFAQLFENAIKIWSQGSARRGNAAVYLDLDHPDADEFLTMRKPGSPIQDLSYGVCVSDAFMERLLARDRPAMERWAKVLEARINFGYPYLFFAGNANRGKPDVYRDLGLEVTHSNLCSEIMLPDSEDESFVCCLSSMNLLHYDEWKHEPRAVETLVYLLDAVLTEFVEKAKAIPYMERAARFAARHRALGVGALGYHSLLQAKMIPFESMEAKALNAEVFRALRDRTLAASRKMAAAYGEPELLRGYGRRHATLQAVAPTKSSAFILGQVSEAVEPHRSNVVIKNLAKGKVTLWNPALLRLLADKGEDTPATRAAIVDAAGSVQHLPFLSDHEKAVFKTFREISPMEVVVQAAQRQRFIDQGQSINLMIDPFKVSIRDLNALTIEAWRLGLKSLYYQISVNASQELSRSILSCSSCES